MLDKVMTNNEAGAVEVELPTYLCHKAVRAARIVAIAVVAGEGLYRLALEGAAHVDVSKHWMQNRVPVVGGYYVQYEDGYASFSPAAAFEAGYTRVFDGPEDEAIHNFIEKPDMAFIDEDDEARGSGSTPGDDWTQHGDGTGYPLPGPTAADAELVIETKHYSDGSSATGVAPLPELSPDQQDAANAASE